MSQQIENNSIEQICLDLGWDYGVLVPNVVSTRTPMLGSNPRREQKPSAGWYNVSCNAGRFLVRATHEVFVADELVVGLDAEASWEVVNDQDAGKMVVKSLREILGLEKVNTDTLIVEEAAANAAKHYETTMLEGVTYIGLSTPQD